VQNTNFEAEYFLNQFTTAHAPCARNYVGAVCYFSAVLAAMNLTDQHVHQYVAESVV
jgi:hypothetical protein